MISTGNSENLSKKLFLIGIPIVVQNLMQYLQLQVDMALLGHYNPLMLSAVGNVVFPYFIHVSFIMTISMGATILISHEIGAGNIQRAKRYSEVSFFYNALISIFFLIYLAFISPSVLNWLGTPAEVHSFACDYMIILSFSFLLLKSLKFKKIDIYGAKLGAFSRNDKLTTEDFEMLMVAAF